MKPDPRKNIFQQPPKVHRALDAWLFEERIPLIDAVFRLDEKFGLHTGVHTLRLYIERSRSPLKAKLTAALSIAASEK